MEDSQRFRQRASECRTLAANTGDLAAREYLEEMAADLEQEADRLDAEVAIQITSQIDPT